MKETQYTNQIKALIAGEQGEFAKAMRLRETNLESGEGYNHHEINRETIDREIARLTKLDRDERASLLTADEAKNIRAWVNAQQFGSAHQAENKMIEVHGVTMDGIKAAMARHNL